MVTLWARPYKRSVGKRSEGKHSVGKRRRVNVVRVNVNMNVVSGVLGQQEPQHVFLMKYMVW